MNNKLLLSTMLISTISTLNASENLGVINIDSSTIDDKFDAKKQEVSNTVYLSGVKIEEHHSENIANVLNKIPGLTVRINEGDSNKIHIRGVASEVYMGEKPGVAIVIDGVPVQERAGAVNIDSDNIESIKIIKGGASYLYGNDALAGAVIITTKRPKAKTGGYISTERGSHEYEKYLGRFYGNSDNFALNLQGSYKASDGYWENSDYWTKSFNGKFQYYIDETSDITFGADKTKRFENDTGSITAKDVNGVDQISSNPTSVGEVGYAVGYNIELDKYFLNYSKDFENNSNLMAQVYKYEDLTTNKSSAYDSNSDGIRDDHRTESYAKTVQDGLKSEYRLDETNYAYMFGLDLARNEEDKKTTYLVDYDPFGPANYLKGDVSSNTNFNEDINALYTEFKYQMTDKLITSINARYDNMKYDYTNKLTSNTWDKKFNETSYKLGATYKLDDDSIIYTNTSTGFRVPKISELYAGDISSGRYTYSNNTNIKNENTYNYEVGFRNKLNSLDYDVAVYQLDRKDVIGINSGNYTGTSGVNLEYDNMADIQNRGLEFSLKSDNKKAFYYGVNYTYLDSKYKKHNPYSMILNEAGVDKNGNNFDGNDEDYVAGTYDITGNQVPRTSKHTINLDLNYKITPKLLITTELIYKSSQYADDLNLVKVEGYSVINLRAKYDMKLGGFDTQIFGQIDNVTDEQYYMMPRVTGDRNEDGVYDDGDIGLTVNPGRVYLAGLSIKF